MKLRFEIQSLKSEINVKNTEMNDWERLNAFNYSQCSALVKHSNRTLDKQYGMIESLQKSNAMLQDSLIHLIGKMNDLKKS